MSSKLRLVLRLPEAGRSLRLPYVTEPRTVGPIRARSLREIEDLEEENVATLFNLSLFWHKVAKVPGRMAFLYKVYSPRIAVSLSRG